MNNSKSLIAFIVGASLGALASWYITKQKYKAQMEAETKSLLTKYNEKVNQKIKEDEKKTTDNATVSKEPTREERLAFIKKTSMYRSEEPSEVEILSNPAEADPEYDVVCWSLYSDGVIVDEDSADKDIVPSEHADDILGTKWREIAVARGIVHVQNNILKHVYDIEYIDDAYNEDPRD